MITTYFQKKKSSRKDGDSTFSSDKSGLTEDVPDKNSACKRLRTDDACPLASNRDLPPLDKPYTDKNDDKNDSIQSLISHLTEDSWRTALMSYVTSKNNFTSLAQFVDNERWVNSYYLFFPLSDSYISLYLQTYKDCLPVTRRYFFRSEHPSFTES
jgi:hypothetical protein